LVDAKKQKVQKTQLEIIAKVDVKISYWIHEISKKWSLYQELKGFEKVLPNQDETTSNLEATLERIRIAYNEDRKLMVEKKKHGKRSFKLWESIV
jgi:hypothetical protein